MTKERAEAIDRQLERLKESCLYSHSDSISYQICELLQEIIDALPKDSVVYIETCPYCENYDWNIQKCKDCNPANNFKNFEKQYYDNDE